MGSGRLRTAWRPRARPGARRRGAVGRTRSGPRRGALRRAACAAAISAFAPAATGAAQSPAADGLRDGALRGARDLVVLADSLVHAPRFAEARWGLLVVDLATDDTLLALDTRKLFLPASTMKLVTAAVALAELGPGFRWRTPVLAGGAPRPSLTLVGGGDPTWSDAFHADDGGALAALAPVAAALRARGVDTLARVTVRDDAFDDAPLGFGWAWDDLDYAYGAGVTGVMLAENAVTLRLSADRTPGRPLRVRTEPVREHPPLRVRARSAARGDAAAEPLTVRWDSTARWLEVDGSLPVGARRTVRRAERHPADAVRQALTEVLTDAGITVLGADGTDATARPDGVARDDATPAGDPDGRTHADTLLVLRSPPLATVLPAMLKPSQNQVAEALFRTLALANGGAGRADSARAVAERRLAAWGVDSTQLVVRDGSGLSRHDFASPWALVHVLTRMARGPYGLAFREALAVAGADGTLRGRLRGTPAAGNARAKTGYVDKARTLAGYVTDTRGHVLAFALLCNNYTVATRDVERVQDALVAALASRGRR